MADGGYSQKDLASKVISAPRNGTDEPDSNPVSLAGHISIRDMGTRAHNENSPTEQPRDDHRHEHRHEQKRSIFVASDANLEDISYKPTNEDTAEAFEVFTAEIRKHIPDESHSGILSAADLVLEALKDDSTDIGDKRKTVEELLSVKLTNEDLGDLVRISQRILDYKTETADGEVNGEDAGGSALAIDFEEDDGDNDGGERAVVEDETEETGKSEIEAEKSENSHLEAPVAVKVISGQSAVERHLIDPAEIKPDFILSRISAADPEMDAQEAKNTTKRVTRILFDRELSDEKVAQQLPEYFSFQHLDLVKLLVDNRWRIYEKVRPALSGPLSELQKEESSQNESLKVKSLQEPLSETLSPNNRKRRLLDSSEIAEKVPKKESRQPQIVDLEGLVFDQGPHLMATAKVTLPKGSFQQSHKLYDVISVPAPEAPGAAEVSELVKVSELPDWAQSAFPANETATLNRIQSKIFPLAFGTDDNLLLCAPTGAGKTNVAMLTFLRLLGEHRDAKTGKIALADFKAVYVAPLKALVAEQTREFLRRLTAQYGVVVKELTGDSSLSQREIAETQILFTTPEKYDVVTRKPAENAYLLRVRLLIIDEVHLLHDDRGPVLESIVVRAKRNPATRIIGLSATLPNYRDVARFLGVDSNGVFYFDASFRPCPLEQQFVGVKEKKAIKKSAAMNEACLDKLRDCLRRRHQLIVFVHSRKDTFRTAGWLLERINSEKPENGESLADLLVKGGATAAVLKEEAQNAANKNLAEVLPSGFGIHHAGLAKNDRSVVEDLFAQGHIQVLVSTATLAWGVNLPAHTVVIKGTDTYNPEKGTWTQLSPQDILQMLGRAGRPRYDKSGEGVVITAHDELQYYMAVLNQQLPIESQLMSRLPDSVNAEVANGAIKSLLDASKWLRETYLFIRMAAAPRLYQLGSEYPGEEGLKWKCTDLVHTALTILSENGLVAYDSATGVVSITELGKIAAGFYLSFQTAALYNRTLRPWMTEIDFLRLFSRSGEFAHVPVRHEERLETEKLAERCPIAIKDPPTDPLAKINVLLQAYIAHLRLDGFALVADMVYIVQSAGRLLRAIHEICLRKRWAQALVITLELCKVVEKRTWQTASPFRQFGPDVVSNEVIRASEASHLPFISYFHLSAAELAEAVNFRGHANEAHSLLRHFPKVAIEAQAQPLSNDLLRLLIDIIPEWTWNSRIHGRLERFLLIVEDVDGQNILHDDVITVTEASVTRILQLDAFVPVSDPLPPNLFVTVVSEKWLNSKWRAPVRMFHMRLPKKPLSPTPLLDVQNIAVSSLGKSEFSECFPFAYFNKFQSQAFHSLWATQENVFLAMAKGTGKTACAELAILALWRQNHQRIVYINPSSEVLDEKLRRWRSVFPQLTDPPKRVVKLTGDLSADIKLQASAHLVLATPRQLDALSRRWRLRKAVQMVDLVVADDLHLVAGGDNGDNAASYEVVLSRFRLMAAHLNRSLRIIALSQPLLYHRDMAEWLGCSKKNTYNFAPSDRFRPPRETVLEPYDEKPEVAKLHEFSALTSGLVFVANRRAAQDAVVAMVEYRAEQEKPLLADLSVLRLAEKVHDKPLQRALGHGIGLLFETMNSSDRNIVDKLWTSGSISFLVATKGTCHFAPQADNILIFGSHEEEIHQDSPYYLCGLLEMVGCGVTTRVVAECKRERLSYYSKFLSSGLPVESSLFGNFHDAFLHEIASRTFHSRQDCIDWLTFTLFYRRLVQNPSFYGLKEVSHEQISEFLSDLVEKTLEELSEAELIELADDDDDDDDDENEEEEEEMSPLNGAMIATHHDVAFASMTTIAKLTSSSRLKNILEAVAAASEFETLPFRPGEERTLSRIEKSVPFKLSENISLESPQGKAFLLLQAHLSRIPLAGDLHEDQTKILHRILPIVAATVDTLSGEGHLNALQAMDLSQMLVQGLWNRESPLKQIPHFDDAMIDRGKKYEVETVFDIMALEDDERDDVLQLEGDRLHDVADFVNKYPNIDVKYDLDLSEPLKAGEPKFITVTIERDEEMDDLLVCAPRFPVKKLESWWVVVGDAKSRQLYGIRKTLVAHETQQVKMEFSVPNPGKHNLTVWCMCDSYLDADKEMSFGVEVAQADPE